MLIPPGLCVVLTESTPLHPLIVIQGRVMFDKPKVDDAEIVLNAKHIYVQGLGG